MPRNGRSYSRGIVKYDQYLARVYEFEEEIVEWDEAFEI